ncbi:hypothetical protein B0H16DRAFT_1316731, partial [Mycena metata]
PTKKRPTEVHTWVSRARNIEPEIKNIDSFVKDFQGWWVEINPAWRKAKVPMEKKTGGPWTSIDIPGPNGFLNVLMCLKWWREAMDDESEEWREAVEDVEWVLKALNKYVIILPSFFGKKH